MHGHCSEITFLATALVWCISIGVFCFNLTHLFLSCHFAFQTINFTDPFYAPPVVLVTPKYRYNNNYSLSSQCNAVVTWVEVSHMTDRMLWWPISRKKVILTREQCLVGYLGTNLRLSLWRIAKDKDNPGNQGEREADTSSWCEARGNFCEWCVSEWRLALALLLPELKFALTLKADCSSNIKIKQTRKSKIIWGHSSL